MRDSILVNDRWGIGTPCKHGDVKNCVDKYNPGISMLSLLYFKFETAKSFMNLGKHFKVYS